MEQAASMQFLELRRQILRKKFSRMNDRQAEAVFHVNGPLLILAGAGSGKTTVLINRIANLIRYGTGYYGLSVPEGLTDGDLQAMRDCLDGRETDKIYMLEANTTPGMTATSFIPQQVKAAGMEMKDVLTEIIENQFE